ncbi:bifunctional polysaccharide deacetylase/glycosyltransferase family 2 protein [Streptomyces flaveus]|uniref:bifunctional polysaccharide deacetylase/glycosyltransferase family 2 protein n=1 Tax=Streptomyces flaveus TaxID=66370 RepID=UPI0033345482
MSRHALVKDPRRHWALLALLVVTLLALLLLHGSTTGSLAFPSPAPAVPGSAHRSGQGPVVGAHLGGKGQDSLTTPAGVVALTFVGGPDPRWTPRILDALSRHHARATFFVVGSRVNAHPALARRILAEGHELGIYSFGVADPWSMPVWRRKADRIFAQRAVAGAVGRKPQLLHLPLPSTSVAPDERLRAEIQDAAGTGFDVVLTDRDTRDWSSPGVDAIVRAATPDAGQGAVVLMHDGGGDRTDTVAAVDRLLTSLTVRGYRFATISSAFALVGSEVPAAASDRLGGVALRWAQQLAGWVAGLLTVALTTATVLEVLRFLIQLTAVWVHLRRARGARGDPPPSPVPVTVVVPAFNETVGIEAAVRSLVASAHPVVEVIVVDDGSTDGTADVAERLGLSGVRVIQQDNAGKPAALNTGVRCASHDLIVMVDGDTVLEPTSITRLVQPFADPRVGAVSGNTKVGNRGGLLGRWQHLEYVVGFNLERRLFDVAECMTTVPGAIGAFRKDVLTQVGGVPADTLAEDTDLTMAVCRAGWRVVYEPSAIAWTEVPSSVGQLWRQRYRWAYGTSQAVWKHRRAALEPGASGRFGRRGLLYLLLFRYALPLLSPMVDVLLVYSLLTLGMRTVSLALLVPLAAQGLIAVWALRLDHERPGPLWTLPLQFFGYRQLMYLVVIQALVTAALGARLRWHRMHRTGMSAPREHPPESTAPPPGPAPALSGDR